MNKKVLLALAKKMKELWQDKRTYVKRLVCAGAAMFAACFTFLFFGPLEMIAFAGQSLDYNYQDALAPLIFASVGVLLVCSPLLALLRGKIYNYVITGIFGATVCGYLQAALMNKNFGLLNGEIIDWNLYKKEMVANLLIWGIIFAVILLVMYLNKKFWRKMVTYVSLILVVMQLVPTIAIIAGGYQEIKTANKESYFTSQDGMNEYSAKDNIFVFVLDYMDFQYIEQVQEKDPAFFDRLDGFTGYRDAIPSFCRTLPALNGILTGRTDLAYQKSTEEFYSESWETYDGKNILNTLNKQGYSIDLYASYSYLFGEGKNAPEYVSNLALDQGKIRNLTFLKKMVKFSAYRYGPVAVKPFFWADTNYYNADVLQLSESKLYTNEQQQYIDVFQDATAQRENPSFKFYHFYGSHPPYYMSESGYKLGGTTSVTEATMGSFNLLYQTFDRMKELGIYEDATIIITADHGNTGTLAQKELVPIKIGLFYKAAGKSEEPFTWSDAQVSTANIPATIVKAAGADYSAYGTPFDEIAEGETMERSFYRCFVTSEWHDKRIQEYKIVGSGNVLENWKKVRDYKIPDENKFYD